MRRRPLVGDRGGGGDAAVRAIGGDEVDQRVRVLEELAEVVPARRRASAVRCVAGLSSVKSWLRTTFSGATPVSRPRAMFSAARSSGRPSRLLLQRAGDELVDLVADLVDGAEHDVGRRVGAVRWRTRADW